MKKNLAICLTVALILPTIGLADLQVHEHKAGELTVYDPSTQNHWYWDMAAFNNSTYEEQINSISLLEDYGGVLGPWRMASEEDLTALWAHGSEQIALSFNPSYQTAFNNAYVRGRFDESVGTSAHQIAGVRFNTPYVDEDSFISQIIPGLSVTFISDTTSQLADGAWVVSSGELAPVPVPGAALLGFIGIATSGHFLRRKRNKTVPTESAL